MAAGAADAGPGIAVPVELRRERRLVCVECPGMVRDVSKMLPTLGGEEGVSRVRSGASPEPRGRYRIAGLQAEGRAAPGSVVSLATEFEAGSGRGFAWETAGNGPFPPGSGGKRTVGETQGRGCRFHPILG